MEMDLDNWCRFSGAGSYEIGISISGFHFLKSRVGSMRIVLCESSDLDKISRLQSVSVTLSKSGNGASI